MKGTMVLLAVLGLLFGIAYISFPKTIRVPLPTSLFTPSPQTTTSIPLAPTYAKVTKVIDGDTIELENGQKVRYIGIDTPETNHPTKRVECYGKEATQRNKELVAGKIVRLEKDVSEIDRFGRLLRYVYIENTATPSASIFVNELLVKEGYAFAATFPPDVKYSELFLSAQQEARKNNKGLWKNCR